MQLLLRLLIPHLERAFEIVSDFPEEIEPLDLAPRARVLEVGLNVLQQELFEGSLNNSNRIRVLLHQRAEHEKRLDALRLQRH